MDEKKESITTIEAGKNAAEAWAWTKENYKVVIQTVFICTAIVLSYVVGRFAMGYEIITIKDFCEVAAGMGKLSINESTFTITVNPPPKLTVNGSELTGIFGQG